MTRKVIQPAYGDKQIIYYEHPEKGNTIVKFNVHDPNELCDRTVMSHSKTDSFGRKVFDEIQQGLGVTSRHFSYYNGEVTAEHAENVKYKSAATTQLVKEIVISSTGLNTPDRILGYEYDSEERITKVTDSLENTVTEYTYDALGQLLTETVTKKVGDTETTTVVNSMTYDSYGNITNKNGKTYVYDTTWKDKLISYDGQAITYDAQGNPTSYLGHTLTWEKGRQLKEFDDFEYTYNANGIRTSKKIDGIKHIYTLEGTKILREEWGTHTLIPLYDNEDSVCGIRYDQFRYFFVKNLQGDVIAITDLMGTIRVKYIYDAWGKCECIFDNTTEKIGQINPFRYRGYYYDNETGLYYLQSRYYDPKIGRFLNSDMPIILYLVNISYNVYSYCENKIINQYDPSGLVSEEIATKVITQNKSYIKKHSKEFKVNPGILAAIIFAEQRLNYSFKDDFIDPLVSDYFDVSLGVAQVRITTAILLENLGYMPMTNVYSGYLYGRYYPYPLYRKALVAYKLKNSSINIRYAAAYCGLIQDLWKKAYPNISGDTAVLATLYNIGEFGKNGINSNPQSNDFGKFAKKNYKKMRQLLGYKN